MTRHAPPARNADQPVRQRRVPPDTSGRTESLLQAASYTHVMTTSSAIAPVAALIGHPTRAVILSELLGGRALTATELAARAGVAPSTASDHLAQLVSSGLLDLERQGRHRYYRLAHPDVARLLETLSAYAPNTTTQDHATSIPHDLRFARTCYDHLAGELGVTIRDGLIGQGLIVEAGAEHRITPEGKRWFAAFGVDTDAARQARRSFARRCLDWSERRPHLAGALGTALLHRLQERRWIVRLPGERTVIVTPDGRHGLRRELGIELSLRNTTNES